MPEGDPELPDEGLPEDNEEEKCPRVADILKSRSESLPGDE